MKIKYDLHVHSCLSPCGSDLMTPAFIAGSAKLEGLDLIALTDHNTSGNCRAFSQAAEFYGIEALYGMELTTSEDIHVLCLFDTVENAEAFSAYVDGRRVKFPNKPEIFGRQLLCDADDNYTGELEYILTYSSGIGFDEAYETVRKSGGVAIPAHINRPSGGALATLGFISESDGYRFFELTGDSDAAGLGKFLYNPEMPYIRNSDAHSETLIGTAGGELELDCAPGGAARAVFEFLKG